MDVAGRRAPGQELAVVGLVEALSQASFASRPSRLALHA
jgi:hypothetical protein